MNRGHANLGFVVWKTLKITYISKNSPFLTKAKGHIVDCELFFTRPGDIVNSRRLAKIDHN